jgi:hypothetical protein
MDGARCIFGELRSASAFLTLMSLNARDMGHPVFGHGENERKPVEPDPLPHGFLLDGCGKKGVGREL